MFRQQDPNDLQYVRRITTPHSKEIKYVDAEPNDDRSGNKKRKGDSYGNSSKKQRRR
ncbi:unnamed protein product [Oikopleura dioica]|uniref:Uncharacterized protein n=1 Tax=Oikopleura dioica TaxID=34765 RepID=E4XS18_OIKDI|nr:unnamed protein product [Oikopleura dioica]